MRGVAEDFKSSRSSASSSVGFGYTYAANSLELMRAPQTSFARMRGIALKDVKSLQTAFAAEKQEVKTLDIP